MIEELKLENWTQTTHTTTMPFARVNSMLTGGKADPDLQKQQDHLKRKRRKNHMK